MTTTIEQIVWFLNRDFVAPASEVSAQADHREMEQLFAKFLEDEDQREELVQFQQDLRKLLPPVITTPSRTPGVGKASAHVKQLVSCVNEAQGSKQLQLMPDWSSMLEEGSFHEEVDSSAEGSELIKVAAKTFRRALGDAPMFELMGHQWRILEVSEDRAIVHMAAVFYKALGDGSVSRLRICPECEKYCRQVSSKRRYCSDVCRYAARNRKNVESGYQAKQRKTRRDKKVAQAMRMKREGRSFEEIQQETGLGPRILDDLGIGPSD